MMHGWHIPKSRVGEVAVGLTLLAILSLYVAMFFKYHNVAEQWEVWHLGLITFVWLLGFVVASALIVRHDEVDE